MRIKSFYADSVEEAVGLARRELGAEAMLVESRQAALERRHLGKYEVVCAVVPENGAAESAPAPASPADHDSRLTRELAELRKQLDIMGRTITRSAWSGARWSGSSPQLSEWHARLMATDLDGGFVEEVLAASEECARSGKSDPDSAVRVELEKRILVDSSWIAPASEGPRVAALVGPPGAGKTSMLVKLAVQYGVGARRPIELWSMDDYRVGGADQLRSFATILGGGFRALGSIGMLAQATGEQHGRNLILIDTPGYGARDMDRAADLAQFLRSHPAISTHLVLTASMKAADLLRVAEAFTMFRPSSLLFTKLDETSSFGTAFSVSMRCRLPISFLGKGQGIPEDMEPATRGSVLSLLCPEMIRSARLAA